MLAPVFCPRAESFAKPARRASGLWRCSRWGWGRSLGCSGVDTPCLGVVHRPPAFGTHGPGEGRLPLDALDIQVAELGAEVAVRHGPANAVFVRRLDRYDRPLDAHVGIERRLFG